MKRLPPIFRRVPADTPESALVSSAHNQAIFKIHAAGKARGIEWRRSGFWNAIARAFLEHVDIEEWNGQSEAGTDTLRDVAEYIAENIKQCNRFVPDLWRIDTKSSPPEIHALEVQHTSRLTDRKLAAYSDLDHTSEDWGFNLILLSADLFGGKPQRVDLERVFFEIVVPRIGRRKAECQT